MKKVIPDCYWPGSQNGSYISHEALCVLNDRDIPIHIELTLYFEDRDPISGFSVMVEGYRTKHIRMDKIINDKGQTVPKDTPYAIIAECSETVSLQYTRVDTTQSQLALMTTIV